MTAVDWQAPVTVLLAAACAVYLLYGWLRPLLSRVAGACGACPGCGSGEEDGEPGLVQIDSAEEPAGDRAYPR